MKITVLGANGKTGTRVVRQALVAGHTVFGVTHHAGDLESNPTLHVIVGDATDANVIAQASKDSDVIISTLGTTSNNSSLMTNTAKAVIAASKITGRKRYIIMSAFTVKTGHLKPMVKLMSGVAMKGMVADKLESENLVKNSDLDWTIVYPTRLTNQPKGTGLRVVLEAEKLGVKQKIARADVAAFMLEAAVEHSYLKREVIVSQ